ncbi:hypothetical protein A0J61_07346 [Choanephora cucurbitarum]|uniref:CUE domain-containing protein n=1 Tax=Choanephora cucurbitarum TaxID=101091 RepID=A0A1C7N648_9FUNG|nr:hypothetical protein A0J61_07346 [Choanephora cucurbitarum]
MENHILPDKSDTVQGLFDEIEHLIDVPFDQFAHEAEVPIGQTSNESTEPEEATTTNRFERPILIESDSDDVEEEEQIVPRQYTLLACSKCSRPIPLNQSKLEAINVCASCLNKKRSRSKSFTLDGNNMLLQFADKLKTSLGASNSNLLSPSTSKPVDRRKSMPSMNSVYADQTLDIPTATSPVPSRPSSRASSFLEDVKQFLSPLSRKSSRNSLFQDQAQSPVGPKRSSSHSSLLDAINFCKPKQKRSPTPSYERRIINMANMRSEDEVNWNQEDTEVFGVQQENQLNDKHVPIRRKQLKHIESREDRINIYNNAYLECMELQTGLVPWIVKQTQKGPPDAWFGYMPPPRQPKKFMGIFKRKSKQTDSHSLRTQQLQLGDELLNRTTPLLNRQYSNGNLSISPGSYFYPLDNDNADLVESPISQERQQQQDEELIGYDYSQDYQTGDHLDPIERSSSAQRSKKSISRPISILKKTQSSRQLNSSPQYIYDDPLVPEDDGFNYEDYDPEDYEPFSSNDLYDKLPDYQAHHRDLYLDYSYKNEQDRKSNERKASFYDPNYSDSRSLQRRSSQRSMEYYDSLYHRNAQPPPPLYHGDEEDFYERFDYSDLSPSRMTRRRRKSSLYGRQAPRKSHYYDEDQDEAEQHGGYAPYPMDHAPIEYQRPQSRSTQLRGRPQYSKRYDIPARSNSYMSDDWDTTLDDLCHLFPRLDRRYVDDFLRSARGDFYVAKNMILDMIMKMP